MPAPIVTRHKVPVPQPDLHLQVILTGLCILVLVYLALLWTCWGTVNPRTLARRHRERRALQTDYDEAFQRRDDLLFHLDWARQRGDRKEVEALQGQLQGMLEDLDALEAKLLAFDKAPGPAAAQEKSQ